jgi:hypothetical protein
MNPDDAFQVMRHQPLRRSRAHLDDLLEGPNAHDPVARLLAAASAPAQPGELVGLESAVAAFAAAPTGPVPLEEKIPMLTQVAGRLAAVKVLAVVAGAAATGGVAFAAVSNNHAEPNAHAAIAGTSSGAPGSGLTSTDGSTGSSSAVPSGSGTSGTESSSGRPGHTATPSPSLPGLCTAWLAHPRDAAKMSGNPAFSVLIKAAGGTDAVNGYCATVVASAHPTHPAHPTQAQNSTSNSAPSSHPSHPAHPTQAQNTKSHPAPSPHPSQPAPTS